MNPPVPVAQVELHSDCDRRCASYLLTSQKCVQSFIESIRRTERRLALFHRNWTRLNPERRPIGAYSRASAEGRETSSESAQDRTWLMRVWRRGDRERVEYKSASLFLVLFSLTNQQIHIFTQQVHLCASFPPKANKNVRNKSSQTPQQSSKSLTCCCCAPSPVATTSLYYHRRSSSS